MQNTLYYGDNLAILRDHIASESVDLVYLDPPFNSNRSYNVLFRQESGSESEAQVWVKLGRVAMFPRGCFWSVVVLSRRRAAWQPPHPYTGNVIITTTIN